MSTFPNPPINDPDKTSRAWVRWYNALSQFLADPSGLIPWLSVNKSGSTLTDIATRNHADLQNINTATYTHLSATHHTDLTDAGDSALHYHATDRARANHSGTQLAATVSDFSTAADARVTAGIVIHAGEADPHSVYQKESEKDAVSGYAGLNTASRTTKGVDTADYIVSDDATKGMVLKDTAGTPHYWRIDVSALGVLSATDLGTTKP